MNQKVYWEAVSEELKAAGWVEVEVRGKWNSKIGRMTSPTILWRNRWSQAAVNISTARSMMQKEKDGIAKTGICDTCKVPCYYHYMHVGPIQCDNCRQNGRNSGRKLQNEGLRRLSKAIMIQSQVWDWFETHAEFKNKTRSQLIEEILLEYKRKCDAE